MIAVFDRQQVKRQRLRCVRHFTNRGFLFDWTMKQLEERMDVVRKNFETCVQIGARGRKFESDQVQSVITADAVNADVICDEEFLPFKDKSIDLIVSPLSLHTVNDLPGALIQINRALKADGLFMGAMLGGETLYELRSCLAEAELELSGGVTPRIAPFADKPQAGALLQRAGFALPVIDSEIVTVTYDSIFPLMHDLRFMGEGNAIAERSKNFTSKSLFLRAGNIYAAKFADADGRICASFEIIFLLGWAAHESQQQPLKRGSATARLADILGTIEIGTGEKPH